MDIAKIAWLAGLFDGEGTIGFYRARRKPMGDKLTYEKYICINCADIRIINYASEILSEIVGHSVPVIPDFRPSKLRPHIYFKVQTRRHEDLLKVLEYLEPYLVGKKVEAQLMLKLLRKHKKFAPYSNEHSVLVEVLKIAKRAGFGQPIPSQADDEQPSSGVCRDLTGDTLMGEEKVHSLGKSGGSSA